MPSDSFSSLVFKKMGTTTTVTVVSVHFTSQPQPFYFITYYHALYQSTNPFFKYPPWNQQFAPENRPSKTEINIIFQSPLGIFQKLPFFVVSSFLPDSPPSPTRKKFSLTSQLSQARGTIICWSSGDKALNSEETRSSNWCRSMKSSTSPLLTQVVKDFWFFFPQKNDGIYEGMTLTVHESQMCKF